MMICQFFHFMGLSLWHDRHISKEKPRNLPSCKSWNYGELHFQHFRWFPDSSKVNSTSAIARNLWTRLQPRTIRWRNSCYIAVFPEDDTWFMIAIFHPSSTATRRITLAWSFFTTFLKVSFWNGQLKREERFNFSFGSLKRLSWTKPHEPNCRVRLSQTQELTIQPVLHLPRNRT